MKKLLVIVLMFVILVLSACTDTAVSNSSEIIGTKEIQTVNIGVIAPMTGDAAAYGEEAQKIIDYSIAEINKIAEKSDYKFNIIYEDGRCDGASASTAFQKLTDINGVKFIIGGLCSSESLGFVSLLEAKNIIAINGWSSSPELENKSSNYFDLSFNDNNVGIEIADELGKYDRVSLISEQNDYNKAMREVVLNRLSEKYPNTKVVSDEEFIKGGTDFRNQIQKIKASNSEIMFLNPNAGVTAVSLAKQIAEIQNWNIKKIGTFTFNNDEIASLDTNVFEETIIVDAANIQDPKLSSFVDKISAEKGSLDSLGTYYTASTLDSVNILTDLILELGDSPDDVKKALSERTFTGYLGLIKFDKNSFVEGIKGARFIFRNGKVENL